MLIKITRLACIVVSGHSLLASIHMNRLPTVKLGQVGLCANIDQNHSSSLWEVISSHYWP